MPDFKTKPEKARYDIKINTIDGTHKKFTKKFYNDEKNLPVKQKRLERLKNQLSSLEGKKPNKFNDNDLITKSKIKNDITILNDEIERTNENYEELEYLYLTNDILSDYYDDPHHNTSNIENNTDTSSNRIKKSNLSDIDKLNKTKSKTKKVKKVPKPRWNKQNNSKSSNIMNILGTKQDNNTKCDNEGKPNKNSVKYTKNKAVMLDDFLTLIDKDHISDRKHKYNPNFECPCCGNTRKIFNSEGICVCEECGEVEAIIVDSDCPNYKDNVPEKSGYPYKRINHYNEWLSLFQAKESTDIPYDVYNNVLNELQKRKIKKKTKITIQLMKKIMKDLNLNKYYEHIPHIISKITGLPPPTISRDMEEKLRAMFKEIQEPFELYRPKDRINFLSYSYVLHKFCQLLELDDFIRCFPLLKSRDKLRQYDRTWRKICKYLKWQFIKSV